MITINEGKLFEGIRKVVEKEVVNEKYVKEPVFTLVKLTIY